MKQPSVIETVVVPPQMEARRLSDITAGLFRSIPSRKGMKKAIDKGRVLLNGIAASTATRLCGGERLALLEDTDAQIRTVLELKLEVLWEDAHIAALHKPAGLAVSGNRKRTLRNALRYNLAPSAEPDALLQPEPAHRIDMPTSGVIWVGKTSSALAALNALFAARDVRKRYVAITLGEMAADGKFDAALEEKEAVTNFKVLGSIQHRRLGVLNLVELRPITGRKHQLRQHLAQAGNPILGDQTYGSSEVATRGLFLHAFSTQFQHPVNTVPLRVKAALPKKFSRLFPSLDVNKVVTG